MKHRLTAPDARKTAAIIAVFGVMLVFLVMQFRNVMVYFDDFGYYVLSYGNVFDLEGTEYTIPQLVEFLGAHYLEENGRILWFFIWLLIYDAGGHTLVQLSAAVITLALLVLLWRFACNGKRSLSKAVLVCFLFCLLPISIQQHGTYWLCPFFLYVAPLVPLLVFFGIYLKHREAGFTLGQRIAMTGLVFLSAFSQEQLGVTVAFMMCCLLVWEKCEKREWKFDLVLIAAAVLGAAILMLSPGLQLRASSHSESLVERILGSTETVIRVFFSADMKIFLLLLYGAVAAVTVRLLKKDRGWLRGLDILSLGLCAFSIVVYCWSGLQDRLYGLFLNRWLLIGAGVLCVCLIVTQAVRFYLREKDIPRLILFVTAVASVGCLCAVPELPARLWLPSWFLLFPFLTDGISIWSRLFGNEKLRVGFLAVCCGVIGFFAVTNSAEIYRGYAVNAEIHRYNEAVFRDAAQRERSGETVEALYLKELADSRYGCTMVYEAGADFIRPWMLHYYGLSSEPAMYFSESGTAEDTEDGSYARIEEGIYRYVESVKITNVYCSRGEDGLLTLGVSCSPIYQGCQIEVNGTLYPTVLGDSFISAHAEIGPGETLEIAVVVPQYEMRSETVTVEEDQ